MDALAVKLAAATKLSKTDAVREALQHELEAYETKQPDGDSLAALARAWRESTEHAIKAVDLAFRRVEDARQAVQHVLG